MYARAAVAALLALLISGDAVRLGWDAVQPWHLVFPYFWFFLLLEALRHRRKVDDAVLFTAGAALGLFYGGIYSKDLQHGFHPLGIDWLSVPCALFDWGMIAVLGSHLAARVVPRTEDNPEPPLVTVVFLAFGLGASLVVYGVHTAFNFYRAERMLGATWLLADLLFAWGAWKLSRRVLHLSEEGEGDRSDWMWAVAAFSIWLPGARIVARLCMLIELPSILMYFFVGAWTAAFGVVSWRLWKERAYFDSTALADSRNAKIAAVWRFAGSLLLILWLGEDLNSARTEGMFSVLIDLPTRALFALAFLTARLKV
ncbi:MAG: hypothetical protein HY923_04590 [Elusimicrobia bacterium]|nr:hypothetical protein [Elusimicrobiota bacterium]